MLVLPTTRYRGFSAGKEKKTEGAEKYSAGRDDENKPLSHPGHRV